MDTNIPVIEGNKTWIEIRFETARIAIYICIYIILWNISVCFLSSTQSQLLVYYCYILRDFPAFPVRPHYYKIIYWQSLSTIIFI